MDQEMPRVWRGEDPAWSNGPSKWEGVTKLTAKQRGAEHCGQSLAVGNDLCHGVVFSPTGLAWIWPVCIKRWVSHPACPGWYALVTRSCGGVSERSDSSIQAHSFHWLSRWFQLIQCFYYALRSDNRTATHWITIPDRPGCESAFFPKHIFALQAAVRSRHEEANPFTWEEQGRNWPAQQQVFPRCWELGDPRRRVLRLKKVCGVQDGRLFEVQWGHCPLPTALLPAPAGSPTPQGHSEAAPWKRHLGFLTYRGHAFSPHSSCTLLGDGCFLVSRGLFIHKSWWFLAVFLQGEYPGRSWE